MAAISGVVRYVGRCESPKPRRRDARGVLQGVAGGHALSWGFWVKAI